MRHLLVACVVVSVMLPCFVCADDTLLQSSSFTYLGAFRVPLGDLGGPQYHGLAYGGEVISYNPTNNSLFITGHDQDQLVAEISIPTPVNSSNLTSLNRATALQNLADITEGNRFKLAADGGTVSTDGCRIGGLIIDNNKLIGSVYGFYDAGFNAVKSHFSSGLTLATTGDFIGMAEVGTKPDPVPQAGHVAGFMTKIPTAWQTALGGKALTGQGGISVLTRTSSGPAAFSFDPSNLNMATPATATALIDYPTGHQTIGDYGSSHTYYTAATQISGVSFPTGSKTVLYTGRQGTGPMCYGTGTNVLEEDGRTAESTPNTCMGSTLISPNKCCYDPANLDHGSHAYPYVYYAWAYDATDLARVKAGGRIVDNPSLNLVDGVTSLSTETYKPWHIKPYSTWEFDFPIGQVGAYGGASTYDNTNKKLYVVQRFADGDYPLIHVYSVNVGDSSPVTGICGNSNGLSLSSAPVTGLCTAGTPSAVSGSGPWSWTCAGSGGGSTANCGATLLEVPPVGDAAALVACPVIAGFR